MMGFDLSVITSYWLLLARGLANTILFSAGSIAGGLCIGVFLALGQISRKRMLRMPSRMLVELLRNTPFLIQLFLIYYALPSLGVSLSVATAALLSLSLFAGTYFAESIRGAISSVPRGQMDSARAVGMSYGLAMRRIIFPQMLGYLLPALTNNMIGVVKFSSILSIITLPEVTMASQIVLGETFSVTEAFTVTALLYWSLTTAITMGMSRLERRTATHRLGAITISPAQLIVFNHK
jgi:His/Glu/Gln/Arg/opine family amino acid ABC transporter permease subunit